MAYVARKKKKKFLEFKIYFKIIYLKQNISIKIKN